MKVLTLLTLSTLLTGCLNGDPQAETSLTENSKFSFSLPDKYYAYGTDSITFNLSRVEGEGALKESNIAQSTSGSAACDVSISNASTATPSITLANCSGNGNLVLDYLGAKSFPILIDNSNDVQMDGPFDIVITDDIKTAYIADTKLDAIVSVDLDTGVTTTVSSASRGKGTNITNPTGVFLNSAQTKLYVVDSNVDAVFEIDIATGDRTIVSSNSVGSGPTISYPTRVVLNNAEDKAYYCERDGSRNVVEVDLSTGDRTLISSNSVGTGPTMDIPYGLQINSTDDKLFLADRDANALLEIDIASGNRVVISDGSTGSGPGLNKPHGLRVNFNDTKAYINNSNNDSITEVNLVTGDRKTISDKVSAGSGPNIVVALGIELGSSEESVYVVDTGSAVEGILEIDINSGDRSFKTRKH
ncbi:MAG: hypothetical protein CME64_12580 [Halobacteriovoraceae bacterium]|nr:hypothetical protein [Halobacteriovoraceae bacterium]|tara:strand:+ start:178779 stop:180026 length:1248 start_codon:yes stop_codon:yes gene_type:complete